MIEARAFIAHHPDHTNWHYVDLPSGAEKYPGL
jgi:hypothetical protein